MKLTYDNINADSITIYTDNIETDRKLAYKLIPVTSLRYKILDRGYTSDQYTCKIECIGKEDTINTIYNFLIKCKSVGYSDVKMILSEVNTCESPFGLNVDYTKQNTCILIGTPEKKQKSFNVYSIEFELKAVNLFFKGTPSIPSLGCIWDGWWGGFKEIGRDVIDSYNNDNFINIRDYEERKFIATINTSNLTDAINLEEFYRTQRGQVFTLTDTSIGVSYPFGSDEISFVEYDVILEDLQVEYMSPDYRKYTLTLILQNHLD